MRCSAYCLVLAIVAAGQSASAATQCAYQPVAIKGVGTYSGVVIDKTLSGHALNHPVDAWLGMEYSNQPVGKDRFRPIRSPDPFKGIRRAGEYGKACPQAVTAALPLEAQAEDCLSFNVFRTQGVPMDEKLPLLLWIHGGAFNGGLQKSFDGAAFVANSPEPLMVVTFHYRLGALGSLPSHLFDEEGLLNLGLRDQRHFLEFAHKHLASFGGDNEAITLGGVSAGGHSAGIHHFGNYGDRAGNPLFARVIYESGSVTSRAFPNASFPLYVTQYNEFMDHIGCAGAAEKSNKAVLDCLRATHVDGIRNASVTVFTKYNPAVTWPFQPVKDGPLFEKAGSQSGYDGTFFHVPVIASSATDEGKAFIPATLQTVDEFLAYLKNGSPGLTNEDLGLLSSLYPDPATDSDSPYINSPNSTQYDRLNAAWSDYAYICPTQETSYRTSLARVPMWKLRWNTPNRNQKWQGVPHSVDAPYLWAEPSVEFPEVGRVHHSYLASFVLTGDPNKLRLQGSAEWPLYEQTEDVPSQFVMNPQGPSVEKDDIRRAQCQFWRAPERAPRLNK